MRNNLIVASLLVTSVLFAQEKNFQKTKDSIESLSTVIITTDAIIGSKFNAKTKQVLLILYLQRIKTFNYDDVSRF
jgi:Fe(3+) dicitrate transport protein